MIFLSNYDVTDSAVMLNCSFMSFCRQTLLLCACSLHLDRRTIRVHVNRVTYYCSPIFLYSSTDFSQPSFFYNVTHLIHALNIYYYRTYNPLGLIRRTHFITLKLPKKCKWRVIIIIILLAEVGKICCRSKKFNL